MHGSEAYFVIGEGLLSEANENGAGPAAPVAMRGRRAAVPLLAHGAEGHPARRPARKKLALAMTEGGGGFGQVPAGFTYFGQFVDHDLTFDKTTVSFGANVSAADLIQGRSPALDLDSLYGKGPAQPGLGEVLQGRPPPQDGQDRGRRRHPGQAGLRPAARRQGASSPTSATTRTSPSRRPTSPSTASTTASSTTRCRPARRPPSASSRAREIVVKHYQWVIRHDYLPRISSPRSSTTCSPTAARCSRRTPSRPTCRRCRSSSPSPRSGSATA